MARNPVAMISMIATVVLAVSTSATVATGQAESDRTYVRMVCQKSISPAKYPNLKTTPNILVFEQTNNDGYDGGQVKEKFSNFGRRVHDLPFLATFLNDNSLNIRGRSEEELRALSTDILDQVRDIEFSDIQQNLQHYLSGSVKGAVEIGGGHFQFVEEGGRGFEFGVSYGIDDDMVMARLRVGDRKYHSSFYDYDCELPFTASETFGTE